MRAFLLLLLTLAIGFIAGWLSSDRSKGSHPVPSSHRGAAAYQCSMHPWVESESSGGCTICGMALSAVAAENPVAGLHLNSNAVITMGLRTAPVIRTNLIKTLRVAGRIVEDETRRKRLAAYVPGRIEKLHVNFEGAEVAKGQPLITLYSPTLLEAEREYRLLYRQSQMNHSTKITAEHGRLLEAMRQRLLQYGLMVDQIKNLLKKDDSDSFSEILAPMDGMVTQQRVVEGQYLEEGQVMLELVDLYNMWFQFDVYENDLSSIEVGQKIDIHVPGSISPQVSSTISFINPNLNPIKRVAEVRAELRNPILRLQGRKTRRFHRGLYAEGQIRLLKTDRLAVPRTAVLDDGESVHVWVEIESGIYRSHRVQIGFRGDKQWEIVSGLSEGESVAVSGAALLESQTKL